MRFGLNSGARKVWYCKRKTQKCHLRFCGTVNKKGHSFRKRVPFKRSKQKSVCGISVVKRENAAVFTAAFSMNEMCGQKRCTLSKALQRNRISILEAFQSNNFCNGFYCLTPKDEFHHLQTNYFSWQLLSLLRSHMYKQL